MVSASDLALLITARRFFPERERLIVEVGSGGGRITRHLVGEGYRNIVATDIDPWAAKHVPDGVTFVLQDSGNAPLPVEDGVAQAVLLIHVIEHMWDPDSLLVEVQRVLRPGGVAVLVTPDFRRSVKTFYEDRAHIHPYVAKSLRAAIEAAGMEVVRLTHTNVMRPLGRLRPIWEHLPALLFTGSALLAVGQKAGLPADQV